MIRLEKLQPTAAVRGAFFRRKSSRWSACNGLAPRRLSWHTRGPSGLVANIVSAWRTCSIPSANEEDRACRRRRTPPRSKPLAARDPKVL